MELGNMIFGHSRGEFAVERLPSWTNAIYKLVEAIEPKYCEYPLFGTIPEFENEVFAIRPYWWGNEDAKEADLPNFVYKPLKYQIRWYKFPFRDSYANQKISTYRFKKITDECIKSLRKK